MKLYYFKQDSYSEEYTVMADSEEDAIKYVHTYMENNGYTEDDIARKMKEFDIKIFGVGQVIETEVS